MHQRAISFLREYVCDVITLLPLTYNRGPLLVSSLQPPVTWTSQQPFCSNLSYHSFTLHFDLPPRLLSFIAMSSFGDSEAEESLDESLSNKSAEEEEEEEDEDDANDIINDDVEESADENEDDEESHRHKRKRRKGIGIRLKALCRNKIVAQLQHEKTLIVVVFVSTWFRRRRAGRWGYWLARRKLGSASSKGEEQDWSFAV